MSMKGECILEKILLELKELNNRVVRRCNNTNILKIDTSSTVRKKYSAENILGQNMIATHLVVLDVGGGFSIAINSEQDITASADYVVEDEEINDITIIGSGTSGTAHLRVSGYAPKYMV